MEWQPISTAPIGEPVLVTDGSGVYMGTICRDIPSDVFQGMCVSLTDGDFYYEYANEMTGWLPAPKTMWEPQKTGNRMLWELGYEPWSEKNSFTFYNKRTGEWITVFDDYVAKGNRVKNMPGDYTKAEILACAQLIRETEATDGTI